MTPERLGLCGAYNWLDAKASNELNPAGPNQPIDKGTIVDDSLGQWSGVNEYIYEMSNNTVERMSCYSLMTDPMTSCGCFMCIIALMPMCNGVMLVNREYAGMTPSGMKFSTLAGMVGGGVQAPGFMGIGRGYITSRKFLSAEGGFSRVVWMPKELKEAIRGSIGPVLEDIGDPGLPRQDRRRERRRDRGRGARVHHRERTPRCEHGLAAVVNAGPGGPRKETTWH